MIRRNEPDPHEGETEPEEIDEPSAELEAMFELAISTARTLFADYPANPETYRTMGVFIRVYMYERGHDLEVTFDRSGSVLTFLATPRGEPGAIPLTGNVTP